MTTKLPGGGLDLTIELAFVFSVSSISVFAYGRRVMIKLALSIASVIALASCGGPAQTAPQSSGDDFNDPFFSDSGGEQPGDHPHASARELIGIHGPERPWSEMSHDDKQNDMIGRFLPIMTEIFQEHDAQRYAEFQCQTCHGTDMRERNFVMPNPHLPQVPPPGTPEYDALARALPESTQFMSTQVQPTMQQLLGMGATFTCNGCHPVPGATAQHAR